METSNMYSIMMSPSLSKTHNTMISDGEIAGRIPVLQVVNYSHCYQCNTAPSEENRDNDSQLKSIP